MVSLMSGKQSGKTAAVEKAVADLKADGKTVVTASKAVEKTNKATKKPAAKKDEGGKQLISMRLDKDVLQAFRAMGKGWQGKINAALRHHLGL